MLRSRIIRGVRNQDFLEDNNKIWDLIKKITYDHDCWTYVKVASRDRDERCAYEALYNHYLEPNTVSNQASMAERKLQTTTIVVSPRVLTLKSLPRCMWISTTFWRTSFVIVTRVSMTAPRSIT
jgi:hypothetical protein